MSSSHSSRFRSLHHPRSSVEHSRFEPRWHSADSLREYSCGGYEGFSHGAIEQETGYLTPARCYSAEPYSDGPYPLADYCLSATPPESGSGEYGYYSSGDPGPPSGGYSEQCSPEYSPYSIESYERYLSDDTEETYTSATDACSRPRHGTSLPSLGPRLAEKATGASVLTGEGALPPRREHRRKPTIPPPPPRVPATAEGVPEWLLSFQHHRLFPNILRAWAEFTNPASGGSSSEGATAPSVNLPYPPAGSASSSHKRKQPSGGKKTSLEDTRNHPDGLGISTYEETGDADGPRKPFACHCYKFHAVHYKECTLTTFEDARSATQHLRNVHNVTYQQLPRMPVRKGYGECRKWYWTWEELFPGADKPRSPYANPRSELMDQFMLWADQRGYGSEFRATLQHAWSSFADSSNSRRLLNPARSEDERIPPGFPLSTDGTARQNDTLQTDISGVADMHTSPLSSSPLLTRRETAHSTYQNKNIGASTGVGSASEPSGLALPILDPGTTEQLPLMGNTSDDFQRNRAASEDQVLPSQAAFSPQARRCEHSDHQQNIDTAFASGSNPQCSMPSTTFGHGSYNDEMDPLASYTQSDDPSTSDFQAYGYSSDSLLGNQGTTPLLVVSGASSDGTIAERYRGGGDPGPVAWGSGNDFSGYKSTSSGSATASSFFEDAYSAIAPSSGVSWPDPSTDYHLDTEENFYLDSSGKGKGKAVEAPVRRA